MWDAGPGKIPGSRVNMALGWLWGFLGERVFPSRKGNNAHMSHLC